MKALRSVKSLLSPITSVDSWRTLGRYMGFGNHKGGKTITNPEAFAQFINTRASHVAQTSLYGYLRTRAGTRFPELFENPDILISINMAKWHIWLACVSDLSVFTGLLIHQSRQITAAEINKFMSSTLECVLQQTEIPEEAGEDIVSATEKTRQRINHYDWTQQHDDDSIFSQSPEALYYWSPIADELKTRDEEIVRNSVRFRWIEVRRSARRLLDIDAILTTGSEAQQANTKTI